MVFSRTARRPAAPSRFRPTLEALEDRCTPADLLGSVAQGLLSLTAVNDASVEELNITAVGVPGVVLVTGVDGTTINGFDTYVFFRVRSIVVRLKGDDDTATLIGVRLTGGLTFLGGDGANTFDLSSGSRVGGSVRVVNGTNGTSAKDLMRIQNDVRIGGSVTVSHGPGIGLTQVLSNVHIAGGLQITGSPGEDHVLVNEDTVLGAGLTADLGGGVNSLLLFNSTVGRSVRVAGGGGSDGLFVTNTVLGAGLAADLGGGDNNTGFIDSLVAGSVRVAGRAGPDQVRLTDISVGGRLAALLGDGVNTLSIDHTASPSVSDVGSIVHGAVTYAGGSGQDEVRLGNERLVILVGPVTIATGDESGVGDFVSIDDTSVVNTLLIDTGAGADSVRFDWTDTSFGSITSLGARATIRTGAGNDLLLFGNAAFADLRVLFAVTPVVDGGPGGSDELFRKHYSIDGVDQAPFPAPGFENLFS